MFDVPAICPVVEVRRMRKDRRNRLSHLAGKPVGQAFSLSGLLPWAAMQHEAGTDVEVCLEGGGVSTIGRGKLHETFGRLRTNSYAIIRNSPCPVIGV